MRIAMTFDQNEYLNNDNVSILAVEIVDPTKSNDAETITFTDPVNNVNYMKKYINVAEDAFKNTIISNYSDCKYKKSTNVIVPQYTSPSNRAITNINKKYPLLTDQYFVPFVGSGVGPTPGPEPEPEPEPEPVDPSPRTLASYITNTAEGRATWDLSQYKGNGIGAPGGKWRIRDAGEAHHEDPEECCTGTIYAEGDIDANGKLVGLGEKSSALEDCESYFVDGNFVSTYDYNGYMEIQQGQVDDQGNVTWPCYTC